MRLAVVLLLAALLAGCKATSVFGQEVDPERFEACPDVVGQQAWDEALMQLQSGNDAAALPLLRTAVERGREHVPAHLQYQDTARHLGGDAAADMAAYYQQLADKPDSPMPAYAKARLLQTDHARSVALQDILSRHGGFAWAHMSLARHHRGNGRLGDAAECYQRAIDRHPRLFAVQLELGEVLVELGRAEEAKLPYENYLRGVPNDRATMRAYVHLLLYRLGQPVEARPWIDRLLADDPDDEAALMDLAAAEWRSGRFDRALEGYLRVLELRPTTARAALNIGYLHYDAFGDDEAVRRQHWPKARKAMLMFVRLARSDDGHDSFERWLGVPYRLRDIEELLGPDDGAVPTLAELR